MRTYTRLSEIDTTNPDYIQLLKTQALWEEYNRESRITQNRKRSFDDSIKDRDSAGRKCKRLAKKLGLNPSVWGTQQSSGL